MCSFNKDIQIYEIFSTYPNNSLTIKWLYLIDFQRVIGEFLLKKAWKIGIFIVSLLCKEVKYMNNYNLNKKTP